MSVWYFLSYLKYFVCTVEFIFYEKNVTFILQYNFMSERNYLVKNLSAYRKKERIELGSDFVETFN